MAELVNLNLQTDWQSGNKIHQQLGSLGMEFSNARSSESIIKCLIKKHSIIFSIKMDQ